MSLRIASIRMKRRPLLTAMAMAPFTGVLARLTDARAQTPLVVELLRPTSANTADGIDVSRGSLEKN